MTIREIYCPGSEDTIYLDVKNERLGVLSGLDASRHDYDDVACQNYVNWITLPRERLVFLAHVIIHDSTYI